MKSVDYPRLKRGAAAVLAATALLLGASVAAIWRIWIDANTYT